jgi:adenosine/AMP kinase
MPHVDMVIDASKTLPFADNSIEVILAETSQGRGILGVIDGSHIKSIETEKDVKDRKEFLRKIGYKL